MLNKMSLLPFSLVLGALAIGGNAGLELVNAQAGGCSDPVVDTDGDGVCDQLDNCPTVKNADQKDADGDHEGDVCEDADGDSVFDPVDECADSDLAETVVIGKCDSGIANQTLDNGCTMADEIAACIDGARNHGQFVRCVALTSNLWKRTGLIRGAERAKIIRCAGRAAIPSPE